MAFKVIVYVSFFFQAFIALFYVINLSLENSSDSGMLLVAVFSQLPVTARE